MMKRDRYRRLVLFALIPSLLIGCSACSGKTDPSEPITGAKSVTSVPTSEARAGGEVIEGSWRLERVEVEAEDFQVELTVVDGSGTLHIDRGDATAIMAETKFEAHYSGAVSGDRFTTIDGRIHGQALFDTGKGMLSWAPDSTASPLRITVDDRSTTDDELSGLSFAHEMKVDSEPESMRWTYTEGEDWDVTTTFVWARQRE
jgi:hypothetical protein